ncbi:ankyrin repeat domain-containing protein [Pseudomarimonas arenosa]|uniref:Ankyrin repeat domain-containing protein n=1 Tax=Pseudomarimonas arenosa TaxID=2774145 RepID=A0AAW3ZGV9_9GAMM|nr:ankyrin repeat domain-containing protein [Pseudomarimonas arenosa]MBD8525360.1 ankyrin repeat domain-containing protein [Pseudomarimonas arenosa]
MSRSEMFDAITRDDVARVAELAYQNVHNAAQADRETGRTALHEAAAQGRCAVLAELMRYVLSHTGKDNSGDTVLSLALRGGHFDCVELVLARTQQLWPDDRNAVMALIEGGHDRADIALALYERGARLVQPDGRVPALEAADARGLKGIVEVIRARMHGEDDLVGAVEADDVGAIGRLLDSQRAKIHEVDGEGWPILARAIAARAQRAIDFLLERGASPDAWLPDRRDLTSLALTTGIDTARYWVAHSNRHSCARNVPVELHRACHVSDLSAQAEAKLIDVYGVSRQQLLQAAAWGGNLVLVKRLLNQGVQPQSVAPAVLRADSELLDALVKQGAAVNASGRDGLPVLHLLALAESESDAIAIAPRLAELGADLTARHRVHGDAIDFAKRLGRVQLAERLRLLSDVARCRWQREARQRGIVRIRFYYDKADGVCFAPNNPDAPLEVGGDYDGAYPTSASSGLMQIEGSGLINRLSPGQRKVIEKLARGEDFGIDEVLATVTERQVEYRK